MEKKFKSDELPLAQLLVEAEQGKLRLPDFQRGWVWDDDHIRSLLASVSLSYPIGSVMTLEAGNPDVNFKARVLEGVESTSLEDIDTLLLDGQQRLTSLFQALKSGGEPVVTRDGRGAKLERYYYASIDACIDNEADREEDGIIGVPADRIVRTNFGRSIELDLSTRELEIESEMFPLAIVLDPSDTMDWQMAYLASGPGDQPKRLEKWKLFQEAIISPFLQYLVPTIELAQSTPKEAVCQVFEKVNTGGVSLTVFELLTATYATENFELRKDWETREQNFKQHELLTGLDGTAFLQIVTLLATYDRRRTYDDSNPTDERVPAVSCKRRDVLRLTFEDYRKWADRAEAGLIRAVPFLHTNRIFQSKDLPYATQLIPLGSIVGWLGSNADHYQTQERLNQWFWCGILGEMYGGATETRFANDMEDVIAWIEESNSPVVPRTVQTAQFQAERLLTLRTRNSAAYKGLYALQLKQGSRDFKTGRPIDVHTYMEDAIDIHHIFPRRWCETHEIEPWIANTIVNKTALDARTNRRIGGSAPSSYLSRIEKDDGIESNVLDAFLRSHDIDPLALRKDDFAQFFNRRFESQLKQVERAMGKPVNRQRDRGESPFTKGNPDNKEDIDRLINSGESAVLEYKSTAWYNLKTHSKDYAITWSVVKTIAAFMNSYGGTLLVGVDDKGKTIGIEKDYPVVKGNDRDGWELSLTTAVKNGLGQLAATDISVGYSINDTGTIAQIEVRPGNKPMFAEKKGEQHQFFFVRLNNSTEELSGPDLLAYQTKHWSE